ARFEMDDGKKCNLYSAPSNILILEIIEEEDEGIIVIVKKIKAFRTRKNFLYVQFLDNTKRKIGHFIECH
ncbi:hypothetical protein L6252_02280, partial [Candidatus Parcubacteria bacterium]|nr:hypothetical protein [Candidatus Parcubacteria bacterium]